MKDRIPFDDNNWDHTIEGSLDLERSLNADEWENALDPDPIERKIMGALRSSIDAHGPITKELIGSATKRIVGTIRK